MGRRLRQVHCIDASTRMPYDDQYCAQLPRKPAEYEACNSDSCPIWIADPWSPVKIFHFYPKNSLMNFLFSVR